MSWTIQRCFAKLFTVAGKGARALTGSGRKAKMGSPGTEVVVIGSGFGGSVAAVRLAEGGAKVTLLVRGPWWDTVPTRSMGITDSTPFPRGARLFTRSVR
ncbi:FAD-binding protein [Thalassorhabdomicrobium marinisediminis]|uniref:FAD-dependent oxidoreductase 2 FAD-binding domain-containing protein n=1 Tax=Thalassorhabdomicrobium marinisediminis TaxID=2170577 RepID=A0A2T7FZB5_9RHOB|nr:hypothetical protein DC363_06175 [Thalassorhabdomicrobium marinisediminis]